MGAGCSNRSAARVQDSVKATNVTELSKEAQEQLRLMQMAGASPSKVNSEKLKLIAKKEGIQEDVIDKDLPGNQVVEIKHKKLWDAVEMNDAQQVTEYLEAWEDSQGGEELKETDLYDQTGNSLVHKAASLGHAEVLMVLLERTGAKPDLVNSSLATPLHLSCKNNREDAVKFLIGCGVDVNVQDEHGQTPLLICCIHGHFEIARMLIEASTSGHLPEPIEMDVKDHRGLSPLNCAAIKGDFDLTKLLIINGGASLDAASPKGCTPLLYAARGGYCEVVRFLILRGASPLRQDNAGGTVLHHAIEKGHTDVLHILQEHGVDVHSTIEIPDNAGRTPIFEAVDNHETPDMIKLLTKSRKEGGFDAKVNIMNYNGQTPLFAACREGHLDVVKFLVDEAGAKVDLTQGELFKEEFEEDQQYDCLEEKFFMDAYKNCMTPLQVACVLGYDEVMHLLIERGANPNLQTKIKGYSCLHLAVLANKPEIIIELLTKTQANPYLPDFGGRTLQDMIEIFIPSYLESFKTLLENLQSLKQKGIQETEEESIAGLASKTPIDGEGTEPVVAVHYHDPNDERTIKGANEGEANEIYNKKRDDEVAETVDDKKTAHRQFVEMSIDDIKIEPESKIDEQVKKVFGEKIALAMIAVDWRFKEIGMKLVFKQAEKYLDVQNKQQSSISIADMTSAAASAVSLTCKEKVIKVFSISLQLLNLLISSAKIEKSGSTEALRNIIVEKNVVLKLLQKSEEGNLRITNKIHETLLDLSFNPEIGEALTSSFILQRIQAHNKASQNKEMSQKETNLGSFKGLLAQLALLYKFLNSFGIASKTRGPLSVKDILKSVLPAIQHQNQDVRNAANKILVDVHKFSGCVNEEELITLNEKLRNQILEKIKTIEVEKNLQDSRSAAAQNNVQAIAEVDEDGEQTERAHVQETIADTPTKSKNDLSEQLKEKKAIVEEKGSSKDWQVRELALKAMEDIFEDKPGRVTYDKKEILDEDFLQNCMILLKTGLEENNMTIYLMSVQVGSCFFEKALVSNVVHGSLQSMIQPIILRTTDTNTRIRKKSVDLIYQIWDFKKPIGAKFNTTRDSQDEGSPKHDSICQIIADEICNSQHGEKAIVGRLGLFIKKAINIEGSKDLAQKPLQMLLGKNYEQLTEFACQWISHKNTKVRQNAMKLIVEICRINCMDPRGLPFKQRIVSFILGIRASQRDPLITKINEVCLKNIVANTSPSRANDMESYIDVSELDLQVATSKRAASMDMAGARKRLQSASRGSRRGEAAPQSMLPQLGGMKAGAGPGMTSNQGVITLPFSEPLTDEQKKPLTPLIELFGLQIITCFVSKTWSTRLQAIEKVEEQIHNLDPGRRDAMSAEINRQNMPIELTFKTFLDLIQEGLKDPVLKNFLALLQLIQKALPTFFRYIQPQIIRDEIAPTVVDILRKTTDMKQKIREASINFCLYLSHQSPVGPEFMVEQVLKELYCVNSESSAGKAVSTTFGNNHLISSCLGLLNEYQVQTKILSPERDTPYLMKNFMDQINAGLRHSNPQVRKEAEKLFKTLYCDYGQDLESRLEDQKPQLVTKLIKAAKQEALSSNSNMPKNNTSQVPQQLIQNMTQEQNVSRAQDQIRNQVLDQSQLKNVLAGSEEHLNALKLPNPKKRQMAIIEIKKAISKKIVTQMSSDKARELFEPLTMLMRQLLQDENPDIYLESLNLLKFIVGSLAPYLSTLDLHLMMGSFIGIIVQNTVSGNMRIQVSSDKVIIFFAKHQNIGSFIVAKEVTKNLDKINKSIAQSGQKKQELLIEKRPVLLRFYGILQLLLQQFSIVLCYQQDFYTSCLETIADTMLLFGGSQQEQTDETALRKVLVQLIHNLYAIDYKLLDASVSKLSDLNRKTPLKKAIIEYESQQKQGRALIDMQQAMLPQHQTIDPMRDTKMSFASSTNRQSLFSPGSTMTRGQSPGGFGSSQYDGNWGKKDMNQSITHSDKLGPSSKRGRMMSVGERKSPWNAKGKTNENYLANHPISNLTQSTWRREKDVLPALEGNLNRTGVLLPTINTNGNIPMPGQYSFEAGGSKKQEIPQKNTQQFKLKSTGGAGFSSQGTGTSSYDPVSASANRRTPRRTLGNIVNNNQSPATSQKEPNSASSWKPGSQAPSATSGIMWPSQAGTGYNREQDSKKPPMYVPQRRQPSESTRQSGNYQSKTGFSSLSTAATKPPVQKNEGYVPSAMQQKPPRSDSQKAKGSSMNSVPGAATVVKMNTQNY